MMSEMGGLLGDIAAIGIINFDDIELYLSQSDAIS